MDLDAYVLAHTHEWVRLEQLTRRRRLSGPEVDELMELSARVGTQLSSVRSSAPDAEVIGYLSSILAAARHRSVGARTTTWRGVAAFFSLRFPAALYRLRWWWLTTTALSVVATGIAIWWLVQNPVVEQTLLSPGEIDRLVDEDFESYYSEHAATSFGTRVWINNAWVAAFCIALGVLGVPIPLLLFANLSNIAVIGAIMHRADHAGHFYGLLLPHGLLELTAVFVAAGTGLRLFWAWVDPGGLSRGAALAREGRTAATIALGLIAVLLVSGVIEAFVTPSGLPTRVRLSIGVVALGAFLVYALVVGRRAAGLGLDGDIDARLREDQVAASA